MQCMGHTSQDAVSLYYISPMFYHQSFRMYLFFTYNLLQQVIDGRVPSIIINQDSWPTG